MKKILRKTGRIVAVRIKSKKGVPKKNVKKGILMENYGLIQDAHAGRGIRQVSFLAKESVEEIKRRGMKIGCAGFGENFTTSGIKLTGLTIGTKLKIGATAIVEITQAGKTCKKPCKIYKKQTECFLHSQGIFARVLKRGFVKQEDIIEIT